MFEGGVARLRLDAARADLCQHRIRFRRTGLIRPLSAAVFLVCRGDL
jgi:hypothetical protein